MANENYLNHPTFGLLYRICLLEDNRELFTTLYAQRLFFLVKTTADGILFDAVSRADGRLLVEARLRAMRREGIDESYRRLHHIHKRTFL